MFRRTPHTPRVLPWILVALAAGSLAAASGEEVLTTSPGRLNGEVDSGIVPRGSGYRFDPQAGQVHAQQLQVGVIVAAAYESNIYLSSTRPESDLVIRVAPAISYLRGDKETGEGGYIKLAYKPVGVAYLDHSSNDRIDQTVDWDTGWRGKKTLLSWKGSAAQLGDATADTGTLTDRTEFASQVRIAWAVREKLSVEVAGGYASTSYDSNSFADSEQAFGEVALRYTHSPKTRVGMIYRGSRFDVDGAGKQTAHRVTGRLEWMPTQKLAVDLELGGEHRTFDNGSATNPVVEARVGWAPKEGTELYLEAYRREQASAYTPGQNYSQGGVALGIAQRLGSKWTGRLEGGYERASYSQVSGRGAAGREDRISFIRPSLEYRFTDDFSMGLFYRYSENSSNRPGLGYDSHTTGIEMGYRF